MLAIFIIIDIYSLHYDIMKRHICQCVCPGFALFAKNYFPAGEAASGIMLRIH